MELLLQSIEWFAFHGRLHRTPSRLTNLHHWLNSCSASPGPAATWIASTTAATTVQNLITQGLPALGTSVGTLPLPAATLANIETDFSLAEITIDLVDVVVTSPQSAQANPVKQGCPW
jgi:hypothetical protein